MVFFAQQLRTPTCRNANLFERRQSEVRIPQGFIVPWKNLLRKFSLGHYTQVAPKLTWGGGKCLFCFKIWSP